MPEGSTHSGILPIYPYQRRVLESPARLIAWLASRRIGKSFTASARMVLRGIGAHGGKPRNQYVFAPGARQAIRLLDDCRRHLKVQSAIVGRELVASATATRIELVTGVELLALPNNVYSVRGYGGDVVFEEAGAILNAEELWRAAAPIADPTIRDPEGGTVFVNGTGMGDSSWFHSIMETSAGAKWDRHRTPYEEALADGFPGRPAEEIRQEKGEDAWETEYNCGWISVGGMYIPERLINAVLYTDPPRTLNPCAAGMDIARRRHYTAVCELDRDVITGSLWVERTRQERNMPWDEQEAWADDVIARCGRMALDESGLGMEFAERLQKRHGEYKVKRVWFSAKEKARLASMLKLGIERKKLRVREDDLDLRRALMTMRRHVTPAGNIIYDAEESEETGHGDLAWAAALALDAAGGSATDRAVASGNVKPYQRHEGRAPNPLDVPTEVARDPERRHSHRQRAGGRRKLGL